MSEKPTKVPRLNTHARDWYDYANQLERELAEVTKQRDSAIAALEKIASLDFVISLPDRMDAVRDIANVALNNKQP